MSSSSSLSVRTVYLSPVPCRCDQCQACMIQGRLCHEQGCPNTYARYDADDQVWVKQRKCHECDGVVDFDSQCCDVDEDFDESDNPTSFAATGVYPWKK